MVLFNAKIRKVAALASVASLIFVVLLNAQRESFASHSPKWRSERALETAIVKDYTAPQLSRYAQNIAKADPLHAVGFFLYALALEKKNLETENLHPELFVEAARRQPSFPAPRVWLVANSIRKGRYVEAIESADTVMRLHSDFRELLMPAIVPLLQEPAANELLRRKVQDFLSWRTDFLIETIKQGGNDQWIESLLIVPSPAKYRDTITAERSVYLQQLVMRGEMLRAHRLWREFPPKPSSNSIFDGDFSEKHITRPFGWRFAADAYNNAEKVVVAKGSKPIVRAYYAGDAKVTLLTQTIAWQADDRKLTFEMRNGGLGKPKSLFWRLECLDTATRIIEQPLANLGDEWEIIEVPVSIPPTGCDLQNVSLEADDNQGEEYEVEIRKVEAR